MCEQKLQASQCDGLTATAIRPGFATTIRQPSPL